MDAQFSPMRVIPDFMGLRKYSQPPEKLLHLIQWLFLLFSLFNAALLVPHLLLSGVSYLSYRLLFLFSLVVLCGIWASSYRARQFTLLGDIIVALSLFLVGVGMGDPRRALGLFYVSLCFRSLYGLPRSLLFPVLTYLASYLASLVFTPDLLAPPPFSPETLFPIAGIPVAAGVVFALGSTMGRHNRALEREHILARAGSDLAAAPDRESIFEVAIRAARALVEELPDARVGLAVGTEDLMEFVAAAGEHMEEMKGHKFNYHVLMDYLKHHFLEQLPAVVSPVQFRIRHEHLADLQEILGFEPGEGTVFIAPLRIKAGIRGMLTVRSRSVFSEEIQERWESLAVQTALALETMSLSEARFRTLVQNSSDVIAIISSEGILQFLSPAIERVFGHSSSRMLGRDLSEIVHPDDVRKLQDTLARLIKQPWIDRELQYRMSHMDGPWRDVETKFKNLLSDPNMQGIILNTRDITERKTLERKLVHQAFHDPLTQLANRSLFRNRVEHALARGDRHDSPIAVMYLDLDNFKDINDNLGHKAGDQLLIAVSHRLQNCLRAEDTIARLGGDEFTVLLEDVKTREDVIITADRIVHDLHLPYDLEGRKVTAPASIGVALGIPRMDSLDDLLRNADFALYEAKNKEKGQYKIFSQEMYERVKARKDLESDLYQALEQGQLRLYYQPVVHLQTGKISELEALIRWQHPQRGLLTPMEFLPMAEETGLILPIEQWVLENACRQVQMWHLEYPLREPPIVYVNLSARQFQRDHLPDRIERILAESHLDPKRLKLEVTELVLMGGGRNTLNTLEDLRSLGVQLAIDDFGTSFSALDYLKGIPIETLKINRSFIQGLGQSPAETAMVRALIAFAKALDLTVIGKGIETLEQLGELQALGCDRGQGYYFAHPLPDEKISRLFAMNTKMTGRRDSFFLDTPLSTTLQ